MNGKIERMLKYNETFVNNKAYLKYPGSRVPKQKLAIISCMDARLTELLPAALGLKNGDAKIIKNAGGYINNPYDSTIFSLIIAIYQLGVETVLVIGHDDCGVECLNGKGLVEKMKERGITDEALKTVSREYKEAEEWLTGFENINEGVEKTVQIIKSHPLITSEIDVYGLVINPETGHLRMNQL